jgi:hypothetical protein
MRRGAADAISTGWKGSQGPQPRDLREKSKDKRVRTTWPTPPAPPPLVYTIFGSGFWALTVGAGPRGWAPLSSRLLASAYEHGDDHRSTLCRRASFIGCRLFGIACTRGPPGRGALPPASGPPPSSSSSSSYSCAASSSSSYHWPSVVVIVVVVVVVAVVVVVVVIVVAVAVAVVDAATAAAAAAAAATNAAASTATARRFSLFREAFPSPPEPPKTIPGRRAGPDPSTFPSASRGPSHLLPSNALRVNHY